MNNSKIRFFKRILFLYINFKLVINYRIKEYFLFELIHEIFHPKIRTHFFILSFFLLLHFYGVIKKMN